MGLMTTLAENFEPKAVFEDELMPSVLFAAMHPGDVDFDSPYGVLEFNENIVAFTRLPTMPSGIVSLHDLLLLLTKTISYTLGNSTCNHCARYPFLAQDVEIFSWSLTMLRLPETSG